MPINVNISVELWPISRLIPRVTNPRTHTPEQVKQVAASIEEFGWTNPILVGADNDVIAGHARLLGARQLRLTEVPVIQLGHLSEAQRRALVIADNQLALNAICESFGDDRRLMRASRRAGPPAPENPTNAQ
jgi:ParB-like chromosome segregation protein Spo0J